MSQSGTPDANLLWLLKMASIMLKGQSPPGGKQVKGPENYSLQEYFQKFSIQKLKATPESNLSIHLEKQHGDPT